MSQTEAAPANEVHLVGRVSGEPVVRELPSGDELVSIRVVVPRAPRKGEKRTQVDTIDVACWASKVRAVAKRLPDGQGLEVDGSLRRRFFATGAGRASRYEVEAHALRRVALP